MHKNLFVAISMTIGAIALALGGSACAAAYGDTSPIYVGVGVGRTQYDVDCLRLDAGHSCDTRASGSGKAYVGFSFAPMSAWRGSELTGSVELTGYYGPRASIYQQLGSTVFKESVSYKGAGVAYRLSLRETEALSLNARIGLAYLAGKYSLNGIGNESKKSTGLTGGLGVSYALGRQWSVNLDYDLLRPKFIANEHTSVHLLTVGAGYKF